MLFLAADCTVLKFVRVYAISVVQLAGFRRPLIG